ncbi:hypothetical protein [Pedobacter arcticus]|uniref:hypothetical protein n=1 Tax=Pedobacter arcticus TaxID=752140 RepID=UPI00031A0DB5|nr:hypothetical protein [Pedobacter arcticus]
MTVYTAISKKIGWEGTATIPTIAEAKELKELVQKADAYAFEKVFRIHRFASHDQLSEANEEAMKIIYEAFCLGDPIFRAKEAKA